MKHCHFSIIYNELPFLKQKLPFLYEHFDQIIFYDLNIRTLEFSNDGTHEFIKNYPDPENKITLIEKQTLSDVDKFYGYSFVEKRKMFAVGSQYVKDDIDVFWCTDADEFFDVDYFKRIDTMYETITGSVTTPHIIFFKDKNHAFCNGEKNNSEKLFLYARITKHKPGNVYGHCCLQSQFTPVHRPGDLLVYHFAYVGENRVAEKIRLYQRTTPSMRHFYADIWQKFKPLKGNAIIKKGHPSVKTWNIKRVNIALPDYIDYETMMKDLGQK
ncbi:MAG TPA: hypothetical protein VKN14_09310 [Flavobacteriaceae bacterium]|nr:hypothetical protein [Flavobacteriaceae bacterium]